MSRRQMIHIRGGEVLRVLDAEAGDVDAPVRERPPIVIRDARPEDEPFIVATFLRSQRSVGANAEMANEAYFANMHPVAESIARGHVRVATPVDDEWLICGWLAFEAKPLAIVFAYTRHNLRRLGVFDALFRDVNPKRRPMRVRHIGRSFAQLRERYGLAYDPGVSR